MILIEESAPCWSCLVDVLGVDGDDSDGNGDVAVGGAGNAGGLPPVGAGSPCPH